MITAAQLVANVLITGAKSAQADLVSVGLAAKITTDQLRGMVLGGVAIAGAALIGVGAIAAKMSGDFRLAMSQLVTSAGELPGNLKMVSAGLLQMSVDTATTWQQLSDGMRNVESAGYHGAAGLLVLKASAEGAKAENSSLASVTDVLTTAMHNYHEPVSKAIDITNSFIKTNAEGKMYLNDLAAALKNVLPIASEAGVKLTDVEAALATMSLAGDKGAMAGTHLNQMLTYLLAPSSKATKALKEVGLTTQEISDEMKVSLPGTVQMITQAVGEHFPAGSAKYIAAISAIVGGNKSMKAMLELSGTSLQDFIAHAANIGPTMTKNATAVDNWAIVQHNFNFQMDAAKNAVDKLLINLGDALLPILGNIVAAITPIVAGFATWVTSGNHLKEFLDSSTPSMVALKIGIIALAGAVGGIMVSALVAMAVAGWAALVPLLPFIAIGAAVALAIAGIVLAVQHWAEISKFLQDRWRDVSKFFSGIWDDIKKIFANIGGWFHDRFTEASDGVHKAFGNVGSWFKDRGTEMHTSWTDTTQKIGERMLWLYNHNYYVKAVVDDGIKWFNEAKKTMSEIWHNTVQFIVDKWTWLKDTGTKIWIDLVTSIAGQATKAKNSLSDTWASVSKSATDAWNGLVKSAQKLWDDISKPFRDAWGTYISPALTNLWSNITGAFNGFVTKAFDFGANIINGIINGINSSIGGVGAAVQNATGGVVSGVLHATGFHGFASGTSFAPGGLSLVGERGPELVNLPRGAQVIPNGWFAGAGQAGRPIIVNVTVAAPTMNVDGYQLAGALLPGIVAQIRHRTGVIM